MSPPVDAVPSDEKLPAAADAVIIGGGIIGSAAAWHLAKKGVSVALVEKGHVAGEQSSRNWGWCRQQGRDRAEIPLIRESLRMWGELDRELGAETGFRRTGILYVTQDPKELAEWERWTGRAREYQIQTRLLNAEEAQALTPGCSIRWIGGMHTPTDGRAEPAQAAPAFAAAARRLGATVHQRCAVRGLETEAGRVSAVITERGAIRTRTVVCAAGVWSSLFCRRHGVHLPQLGVRASVLRTDPAPEVVSPALGTPAFAIRRRLDGGYNVAQHAAVSFDLTPDAFRYLRVFWPAFRAERENVRLRIGRRFFEAWRTPNTWALDGPSPFEAVRVFDPEPDHRVLDQVLAALAKAFPALNGITEAQRWAGMIDTTPDAVPVISAVDALPGLFLATGFSGHGFGIGPAAGRLAADLVAGDPPLVDPQPFRYTRMVDGTRLAPEAGL